jgi:hypothetical protein
MSSENNKIKRIFLTHCSAKKDNSFKENNFQVTPDRLYTATVTQRFMNRCKNTKANWAIFSDKYGIWFSDTMHAWYEKDPNKVTDEEFNVLVQGFNSKLKEFDEIWFYYNPGRFHPIYKRLLDNNSLKDKIKMFTHINEIQ